MLCVGGGLCCWSGQVCRLDVTRSCNKEGARNCHLESAALLMCWEECSDAVHALKGGAGEVLQSLSLQGGTPGFGVSGSQY